MSTAKEKELEQEIEKLKTEILSLSSTLNLKEIEIQSFENKLSRLTRLHEKSYKYCEDLRSQVENLSQRLQSQSAVPQKVDVGIQVDFTDLEHSKS